MGLHLSTWPIYFPGNSQQDHYAPVTHCCSLPHKVRRLTSFGDRAFQHAAPRLWNGLPISLDSANNLNSFKKSSKDISFQGCLQRVMCFTDTVDSILAWTLIYFNLYNWSYMNLFFSDAFNAFLNSYWCVCVPLNYLTCEKNGAIELQHNNNNTPQLYQFSQKTNFQT